MAPSDGTQAGDELILVERQEDQPSEDGAEGLELLVLALAQRLGHHLGEQEDRSDRGRGRVVARCPLGQETPDAGGQRVVGRRGVSALTFRGQDLLGSYTGFTDRPGFANAREIGEELVQRHRGAGKLPPVEGLHRSRGPLARRRHRRVVVDVEGRRHGRCSIGCRGRSAPQDRRLLRTIGC